MIRNQKISDIVELCLKHLESGTMLNENWYHAYYEKWHGGLSVPLSCNIVEKTKRDSKDAV